MFLQLDNWRKAVAMVRLQQDIADYRAELKTQDHRLRDSGLQTDSGLRSPEERIFGYT